MGSLQDADYYVTHAAAEAGRIPGWNGLDPIYTAILSDSGENAKDRIAVAGSIYNTNNELIANDPNDLWDGSIANPIAYDEFGDLITFSPKVWTGTDSSGDWEDNSCGDWDTNTKLAAVGLVDASASSWVFNGLHQCQSARLYGISPVITVPDSGDYDGNGVVDGLDFLKWQRGMSPNPLFQDDLALWESQYGGPPPPVAIAATSAAVPEPTTSALALAALCLAMSRRRSF